MHSFFITDDNFARNQHWEPILDRLIQLRKVEKMNLSFVIQVDTLCHKLPKFIKKCESAGVKRVFIGLENINPDSLAGAKKRQNKITEYRKMLLAWKEARVITYAGYIPGFPNDTVESIRHDIEIIKNELPVDLLEFFFLTPLPGSADHLTLHRAGVAMDADMNRYDLNHACAPHAKMSRAEWERAYYPPGRPITRLNTWRSCCGGAAKGANVSNAVTLLTWFKGSINVENIHPLEGGLFRLNSGAIAGLVCRFCRGGNFIRATRSKRSSSSPVFFHLLGAASDVCPDSTRSEETRIHGSRVDARDRSRRR